MKVWNMAHRKKREMKNIFSIFALSFVIITSASANAEHLEGKVAYNSQKPVACTSPEEALQIVANDYGEMPYFRANGIAPTVDGNQFMQTKVVISINLETKTFTVLEWVTPETVCMVANGNGFEFLNPQKTDTKVNY